MKRFPSHFMKAIYGLASVLVLSSACSKPQEFEYVDDAVVEPEDNDNPVVTVTDENGNQNTLPPGNTIGIYIVDGDGNVTLQQVVVGEDGNAVLPSSGQGTTVIAYTPYQEEWGNEVWVSNPEFSVREDQSKPEDYTASDLMIGTTSTDAVTRAAEGGLEFMHKMARVAIHVVDETGRVKLDHIHAELLGVETKVSVDLSHQQVTAIEGNKANIPMLSEMTTDWRISSYAIVAPQAIADGTPFYAITLYGNRQSYPIPEASTLEGGKTYTINLRLTGHGLIADGWRVTDWDEEDAQDIHIES